VAGGLALANFVYGYFVFPETLPREKRRGFSLARANPLGALVNLKKIPSVLPIAGIYFVWQLSSQIYPATWAFYGIAQYGWDTKMVGLSLTLVGMSMAFAQLVVIGRAVNRFGERGSAMIGMVSGTIGFFVIAFLSNGTLALIFMTVTGLQALAMPSLNAMMSKRTPPDQQGELQGLNGSLSALSLLFAQVTFTYILSYYTSDAAGVYFPGATFIAAGALGILAICGLLILPKQRKEDRA